MNFPTRRHRMAEWVTKYTNKQDTRSNNMLPTRDSIQLSVHTQAKSERMEKETPCKW